jgi:hypothetical protein
MFTFFNKSVLNVSSCIVLAVHHVGMEINLQRLSKFDWEISHINLVNLCLRYSILSSLADISDTETFINLFKVIFGPEHEKALSDGSTVITIQ